jgi:hypothetical protein
MSLELTTIAKGDQSGIHDTRHSVIRLPAEWEGLWKAHTSYMLPAPELPPVDFEREMVVALMGGTKTSGGYSVEITSIRKEGDRLVVSFGETGPPPDSVTTSVITYPFHIVKTARHEGEAEFRPGNR